MEVSVKASYQPPTGFVEDKKDSLIDLDLTDSSELWLIQWPINEPPDFDGQQLSLNLNGEGHIGTFEGSSGLSYEVISSKSQGPEAMVFLSSASEAKIVGKISRRVSLVHYPEPSEFKRRKTQIHTQRSSMATSTISGRRLLTPSRSSKPSHSSTPSSKMRGTISGSVEPSRRRQRAGDQRRSMDQSTQDSGKGNSGVTSTESLEHSERKLKKGKKIGS